MKTELTKRQTEVANFICKGLSNKEIAKELDISSRTVESHISKIFITYNVTSRTQLTILLNKTNEKTFQGIVEDLSLNVIKYALQISTITNSNLNKAISTARENINKDFLKSLTREQTSKLNYMLWSVRNK
jgi:DNA-binding CsgD family transcriptional regulator